MSALNTSSSLRIQYHPPAAEFQILPIKVTPHYQKLVQAESQALGHQGGPIFRAVYPTPESFKNQITHEVPDFVEDQANMPKGLAPGLIHKYPDRALFLVTDKCVGHCMYCFRQQILNDLQKQALLPWEERITQVINYLIIHPQIKELILSGGDPLTIPLRRLNYLLEQITTQTKITDIRLHTRNLIFAPRLISDKLAALLNKYRIRVYIHVIHPYEIDCKVTAALQRLHQAGVRIYSQFPILRMINDHPKVLEILLRRLDELQVRPINLFIPDPIRYSASFRIPLKRLFAIIDQLFWCNGSWVNSAHLVLDTPIGKVRREDICFWDKETGKIIFQRNGRKIIYYDFPEELDHPGELQILLWRG